MQERTGAVGFVGGSIAAWVLVTAALALGAAASAQSTSTIYAATTTPLLAAAGGASQGSVMPGTALGVLDASGGDTHVQIQGWAIKGSASVVFQDVGLHVVLATLDAKAEAGLKVVKTKEDDYGTTWEQVVLEGWVATKDTASSVDTVWKAAESLYDSRCSACHALHDPGEFTANQWPGILKTMGQNASLDQQTLNLVTRYLQAHGKSQ